ncbi:hypothetical protein U1Q18_041811 [Sarracenia purpurea var. burkii]
MKDGDFLPTMKAAGVLTREEELDRNHSVVVDQQPHFYHQLGREYSHAGGCVHSYGFGVARGGQFGRKKIYPQLRGILLVFYDHLWSLPIYHVPCMTGPMLAFLQILLPLRRICAVDGSDTGTEI